ncbi:hypothetical protein ScPMuIL_013966 [Solemya velum]
MRTLKHPVDIVMYLGTILLSTAGVTGTTILSVPNYLRQEEIRQEVSKYQDIANKIIDLAVHGSAQNQTYNRLAYMTDRFGNRIAGSRNLEHAIDYMLARLTEDGLENVHGEDVMVPHWVRGKESAMIIEPRRHPMAILGLGSSIATPSSGIKAEALVVKSFDELHKKASQAKGKIIVYNQDYHGYGTSVKYRRLGATEAAKVGGVASLIRSVTPFSINSPHTGQQDYGSNVTKIPTACITVEDAEMLYRMSNRGEKIVIHLKMSAKNLPPAKSRNTVAEIVGSKYPEQVVLVSGHFDSWDVGEGAMDDGGGAFISWQTLTLIRRLGLRPKRTLRMVLWTAEEQGGVGGRAYYERHKSNLKNMDLVMESDVGTFTPLGLKLTANKQATAVMKEVMKLLKAINASQLSTDGSETDITRWVENGVPGASLLNQNEKYFYFHHTNGDTMTVLDPHQLDLCAAVWAVVSFTVADLCEMLPR